MRNRISLSAIVVVLMLSLPAWGQLVSFTASNIQDSSGNKLAHGVIRLAPADNSGNPVAYRIGSSGQSTMAPIYRDVTNGVIMTTYKGVTLGALQLADSTLTSPANVCFKVTATDSTGQVVLGSYAGHKSGYDCVQPAANVSPWCTSGVCNFDLYPPNLAPIALVQSGPTGPQGLTGPTGPQGPQGATGTVTTVSDPVNSLDAVNLQTLKNYAPTYPLTIFTGANFGQKAVACNTWVSQGGIGGVCDGRMLPGAQTSNVDIVIGDGTHRIVLLWPIGTITFADGKHPIYRSYSTNIGFGSQNGTKLVCTNPAAGVACLQTYPEPGPGNSHQLSKPYISGIEVTSTGTVADYSIGWQIGAKTDPTHYADVLSGIFSDMWIHGFDIGTDVESFGGCNCYNKLYDVSSWGISIGVQLLNSSGYAYGDNSNQWESGTLWGKIGLLAVGDNKFTFKNPDFESNKSTTGKTLFANVDPSSAGSGYVVGDTVSINGGAAVAQVVKTTSGVPLVLQITNRGTGGYSNALHVATTTLTGTGSGLQVDTRTGGYMVLAGGGATKVENPYEEAGDTDYICGSGNDVEGAWGFSNGSKYAPTYCTGTSNTYGGPASNFVWGSGTAPRSIGLNGLNGGYLAFGSGDIFDMYLDGSGQLGNAATNTANVWMNGPIFAGRSLSIYGRYGHAPWYVGTSYVFGGTAAKGKITLSKLSLTAPTLIAYGGTGTTYTYYFVGYDGNGGVTTPTSAYTVSGPATLGAVLTATPKVGGSGYAVGNVVTLSALSASHGSWGGGDGTATAQVTSIDAGGAVTGLTVVNAGSQYHFTGQYGTNIFPTTGGVGIGLTVTITNSYVGITPGLVDGVSCVDTLRGDTSHIISPAGSSSGGLCTIYNWIAANSSGNRADWGQVTQAFSPASRNTTADFDLAGQLSRSGTAIIPETVTGAQGNGTKVQTAGTNSGVTGAALCNDAGGAATTSGCASGLSVTNKGDIQTHNGTSPDRLAAGVDGQVLTLDSTQPQGIKWATPGGTAGITALVPSHFRYLGDGSDGATTCNNISKSGVIYATTFDIAAGNTCTVNFSGSGLPLEVHATGACTIAGKILADGANKGGSNGGAGDGGASGGGGGGGSAAGSSASTNNLSVYSAAQSGGASSGGAGPNGAALSTTQQRWSYHWPRAMYTGGSRGGTGGSSGPSGGGGGQGILFVCGSINFSGVIDVSGAAGASSTGNSMGSSGGGGGGYVILIGRDSITNTGTLIVAGGQGGTCYAPAVVLSVPTTGLPTGNTSGTGAFAHVSAFSGGNPSTITVDAAGSGYNYTPACSIVGGSGSGATCAVTMAGSAPNMTVSSISVSGGNAGYGTGTTYTTCGQGGYGGNGWSKAAVMQ